MNKIEKSRRAHAEEKLVHKWYTFIFKIFTNYYIKNSTIHYRFKKIVSTPLFINIKYEKLNNSNWNLILNPPNLKIINLENIPFEQVTYYNLTLPMRCSAGSNLENITYLSYEKINNYLY